MASASPEPAAKTRHLRPRGTKRKNDAALITVHNTPKRRRTVHNGGNAGSASETGTASENTNEELQDVYCWECHKECVEGALDCASCPRTYHPACIPPVIADECGKEPSENWICPVCLTIMKAECADTRSWAMQQLSVDQLATLLGFVLQRMKHSDVKTSEAFHNPVPRSLLPDYYDIVFHPMDLSTLDKNVKNKAYASTEAFLEDAKWLVHNNMVYNGCNNKTTSDAKVLIRICRQELSEIELCPDCYLNSCIKKDNWFTEPCTAPHCLVWAKLKGFPYWPAKALRVSAQNTVDVRFFGAHDRAWLPINQVYLLSEECPVALKSTKKYRMDKALDELQLHLQRLREKFGEFNYAPLKTDFKPEHLYFCSILFGKTLANSDTARKMLATAAGRRYRDMSDGGLEDQSSSRKSVTPSVDDQASGFAVDDDQSSYAESNYTVNILQKLSSKLSNQKDRASANEDMMASQESNDSMDSTSLSQARSEPTTQAESSPSQPPLRVKLNISGLNKPRVPQVPRLKGRAGISNAARHVTKSPDSTSAATTAAKTNGSPTFAPLPQVTTNGIDSSAKTTTATPNSNAQTPGQQLGAVSLIVKKPVPSVSVTKATTSKDDNEHGTKKRTLQSVLENLHSNVRHRSVSPASSDASSALNAVSAPKQTDSQPQTNNISTRPSPDKRVNAGASTSTVDCAAICEKYQEKINESVQAAMAEMKREMEALTQVAPSRHSANDTQAQAQLVTMRGELSKMQIFYNEAVKAVKHTARTQYMEVQQAMEAEKTKIMEEMKRKFEEEKKQAIAETKLKQWCANCGKEAVFYCCWNTSYCDYPCQQQHWPKHQATCAQIRQQPAVESVAPHNAVASPMVHSVQYVAGSRLNSSQAAAAAQTSHGPSLVYASPMPNTGGYMRTAGQQGVSSLTALVRKR